MDRSRDEYCEIASQLDAREILRYLNNLGIRNISGEVLKYFITDLKKLIKYDLQHRDEDLSTRSHKSEIVGPERLHSASTFSSRTRSKVQSSELKCSKECEKVKKPLNKHIVRSAPNLFQQKTEEHPLRRACSCIRVEKKPEKEVTKESSKTTVNSNIIKVPKQFNKRKHDPVSLYHYYTSLWAKYKPNVPGENDWSDLRWNIRQKMVGNVVPQTSSKMNEVQKKDSIRKNKMSANK